MKVTITTCGQHLCSFVELLLTAMSLFGHFQAEINVLSRKQKVIFGQKINLGLKGQASGREGMFIKEQVALHFQRSVLLQSLKVLSKEQVATILPSLDMSQPETLLS